LEETSRIFIKLSNYRKCYGIINYFVQLIKKNKMKTFFLIFLVLFMFNNNSLISQNMRAEAIVISQYAPVYEKPDVNSTKIRTLTKNIKVTITQSSGDWYYIQLIGKAGWSEKKHYQITQVLQNEIKEEQQNSEEIKKEEEQENDENIKEEEEELTNSRQTDNTPFNSFIEYGICAGVNLANLHGSEPDSIIQSKAARTGLAGGAFAVWHFSRSIALQAYLLYSQKGATGTGKKSISAEVFANDDVTLKFDYVEVPILFRASLFQNSNMNLYLSAGPYLGYNFNSAMKSSKKTLIFDENNKIDYGITGGLGTDISFGNTKFMLNVNYSYGVPKVVKIPINKETKTYDIKNNSLTILLGYYL
jgi:hypothetical protein